MNNQILISKDGVQQGYPASDIQCLIDAGTISGSDWAWKEGLTNWVPLNQLIGAQPSAEPPSTNTTSRPNASGVTVEPTHEDVIWEGNPSQYLNAEAYGVWAVILFGVLIMGFFLPTAFLSLILLVPVCALHCAFLFWKLKSIHYNFSTQRIRIKTGLFSKKIQEIELFRVRDTSADQSFTDRIVKIGNLRITSGDADNPELFIQAIPDPMGIREKLRQQVIILRQKFGVRELDMM